MFPPPFSTESIVSNDVTPLARAYRDVVIYDGNGADDDLYEGPIVVHANGWIELEGDRLLSPSAIHHIDIYDGIDESGDKRTGDNERGGDDNRTSRFRP